MAHVLEHMVFKGSRRYGPAELSRRIEEAGGSLNAETSREFTHYHIDLPSASARLAIESLAELLCRAEMPEREWALERPVILEEMKRRIDDPETLLWESLQEALYADEPHQRSVIGSEETVSSITAEQLRRFYREHYTGARSLVVVCGDASLPELRRWVRQAFAAMPAGALPPPRRRARVSASPAPVLLKRPVQHSYAAVAWPTPPADHPDQEALDLLAAVLGEGRTSRLVRALREDDPIVWSVSVNHYAQETGGLFTVFMDVDPSRREHAEAALARQWTRLHRDPPSRAELQRACNLIQTSWLQGLDTFHHRASVVGAYALDGQLPRLTRYLTKIQSLTPRDLARVIRTHLQGAGVRGVVEP